MARIKQNKMVLVLLVFITIATTWFLISYMNAKKFGPTALFYPMSGPLFMITIPVLLTLGIVVLYFTISEAIIKKSIFYWINAILSLIFIFLTMYFNIFFYIPYIALTTSAMNTLSIVVFCSFIFLYITNIVAALLELDLKALKKKFDKWNTYTK